MRLGHMPQFRAKNADIPQAGRYRFDCPALKKAMIGRFLEHCA